mgnify:CR=1 FL=1
MNPIDIINNEVICAGKLISNGQLCLLHCRINQGGNLEFTGRSNNQEAVDNLVT